MAEQKTRTGAGQHGEERWSGWYHDAAVAAASLPALLVEASAIAHTVAPGWHGRRRAGAGETFWQYRRFAQGDLPARIDWRRSARDEHLYVREQEWEAAHTVWLWPDRSASMVFRSHLAPVSKEQRAIVMALALADILVRGGERVAAASLTSPSASQRAPRRMAEALARADAPVGPGAGLPPAERLSPHTDYVMLSDFLDPVEQLGERIATIAAQGVRCHLIQILDPVEETFPFEGRMEFIAAESSVRYLAGRAETLREAYCARLRAHRAALRAMAERLGGTFTLHHTDQPPQMALLALHGVLSAPRDMLRPPTEASAYAVEPLHLVGGEGGAE